MIIIIIVYNYYLIKSKKYANVIYLSSKEENKHLKSTLVDNEKKYLIDKEKREDQLNELKKENERLQQQIKQQQPQQIQQQPLVKKILIRKLEPTNNVLVDGVLTVRQKEFFDARLKSLEPFQFLEEDILNWFLYLTSIKVFFFLSFFFFLIL